MRFTEHELTVALTAAAKAVVAAGNRDARKGRTDADTLWNEMSRYQRYQVLAGLGDQVLPVLLALPDVEVAAGTRPTFTDAQVMAAVEQSLDAGAEGGAGGLRDRARRKVTVAGRAALVQTALAQLPPRQDPDALIVPDHL